MCASPLSFLRAGPPPPRVVLLPDALFFSRAVPISAGATQAEATAQIELALESIAPFPLAQLYYGSYWVTGASHAYVYAAYRRRFTTDQTAAWGDAEVVIPTSVALFGAAVQPATTIVLSAPDGLTAVHWDSPQVPSKVVFRPLQPEDADDLRAHTRDDLLRSIGGSKTVIDLLVPPAAAPSYSDRELVFRSGDLVSKLTTSQLAALDVRDKAELEALRGSRKRDLMLWRTAVGCAAALLLLLVGELALVGGKTWQNVRETHRKGRAPTVQKIKEAQELAVSIQDLVTKRFLPLEMATSVLGVTLDRKPGDVVILRLLSNAKSGSRGAFSILLELETTNPAQVPVYRNEILKLPEVDHAELEPLNSQNNKSLFRLNVTFKPGVLKPEAT